MMTWLLQMSLSKISKNARHHDVFLVCYKGRLKACHRRVLLRIAEERFGAEVRIEGAEPKKQSYRPRQFLFEASNKD
jgi:hypothetical protein